MTMQSIKVELPEEIYQRLKDMASMTHQSLEEISSQTIRGNLPPTLDDPPPDQRDLAGDLQLLADEKLWVVAREPLPAQRWRRHQQLLSKAEAGALTSAEQSELTDLREATDRFVTRRSYALASLKWRGYTIPATL
jgi:hypothetical protein